MNYKFKTLGTRLQISTSAYDNQNAEHLDQRGGFILGFDSNNNLFWSTFLGGNNCYLTGLSVDLNNNFLYFTGSPSPALNSIIQIEDFATQPLYWQNGLQVAGYDAEVGRFDLHPLPTGINSVPTPPKEILYVYPNPTSDVLNIILELPEQHTNQEISIKIIDVLGRVLLYKTEKTDTYLHSVVNIKDLSNATYLLQVITGNKIYTKTFILNK